MNLINNTNQKKRLDYVHHVEFNGKQYTREETIMPQSFTWESTPDKLEDFHIIKWSDFNDLNDTIIHYYSHNNGWDKDGKLDKSNPIPELEQIFKKTMGKNLIYF